METATRYFQLKFSLRSLSNCTSQTFSQRTGIFELSIISGIALPTNLAKEQKLFGPVKNWFCEPRTT